MWRARTISKPSIRTSAFKGVHGPRTKIDRFGLAKLEANSLKPSPEADPKLLVRRVYLDLVGLKPTYEEEEAFVKDPAPDRYEKLVERLLASAAVWRAL